MSRKIFYIASVQSKTKIVINGGSLEGIKKDQRFLIYALDGEEIFDPITKESLGKLEVVKGTGIATDVYEKMCTIESDMYRTKTDIERIGLSFISSPTDSDKVQEPFNNPQIKDFVKIISY